MRVLGFRGLFARLFIAVMLALIGFAIAMLLLAQLVHETAPSTKNRAMASHIMVQIDPFLQEINTLKKHNALLDTRFSLALVKKSFDIFDANLNAKMGLYDKNGVLIMESRGANLPTRLTNRSWVKNAWLALIGQAGSSVRVYSSATGYTLWYESLDTQKRRVPALFNLFSGTLMLLIIMGVVLWWLARTMTARLEVLSAQMARLGEGDFSARVQVAGCDEIATLGAGFNHAAQKIEALIHANTLLLAHASHEFRTPITRMRLHSEMLTMLGEQLDPMHKDALQARADAINKDLNGLNELVEGVLLASRLGAGFAQDTLQKCDLYAHASAECTHFDNVTLHGTPTCALAQPKLIAHVLQNLLNNAHLHGTPPIHVYVYGAQTILLPDSAGFANPFTPTPISQTTQNTHEKSTILRQAKRINERFLADMRKKSTPRPTLYAMIAVVDAGSGIPPDKREDIFSPFIRLSHKKGSGLGLSLVAQIAQDHGGQAKTSTAWEHTCFLFAIPTQLYE